MQLPFLGIGKLEQGGKLSIVVDVGEGGTYTHTHRERERD